MLQGSSKFGTEVSQPLIGEPLSKKAKELTFLPKNFLL
jgi:hypothetical protein